MRRWPDLFHHLAGSSPYKARVIFAKNAEKAMASSILKRTSDLAQHPAHELGGLHGYGHKCGNNQRSLRSQLRTRRIWLSQRMAHIHATVWKLQDEMQGVFLEFLESTNSMLGILEVE